MKNIWLVIVCLCFFLISCEKKDVHYQIWFNNNTDYCIGVFYDPYYPDTTIAYPWFPADSTECKIQPDGNRVYTNGHFKSTFESFFESTNDKLMFFVFDYDTITTCEWQDVVDDYMVKQRYDVSLYDLNQLDWRITFPPGEEMRNIKMWPPYGTYDENGHRIR